MADKKPLAKIISERMEDHFQIPARERLFEGIVRLLFGLVMLLVALVEVLGRLIVRIADRLIQGAISYSFIGINIGTNWLSEWWKNWRN
jgi:hypothetical protein